MNNETLAAIPLAATEKVPHDGPCAADVGLPCRLCQLARESPMYAVEPPAPPSGGPGTELANLLHELGVEMSEVCRCPAKALEMDQWGIDGCKANLDTIHAWMREASAQTGWLKKLAIAGRAVRLGVRFNPLDPVPSLVAEALRRAEKQQQWAMVQTGPVSHPWDGPIVRHLAYHVYPIRGNGTWQRNISRLRRSLDLFNGRRVVAIATDANTDRPEEVQDLLGIDAAEYLVVTNNAALREVRTFLPLLEKVLLYDGPADVTFYGHAKGVTRPVNPGVTVHPWTDLLYATCLEYWPVVERLLERHATVGTFKKLGFGFAGSQSRWHWSGSFFWLRNCRMAGRDWRRVDQHWWGNESWVGLHFRPEEAAELLIAGPVPAVNLYDMSYLKTIAMPAFVKFKQRHEQESTAHVKG